MKLNFLSQGQLLANETISGEYPRRGAMTEIQYTKVCLEKYDSLKNDPASINFILDLKRREAFIQQYSQQYLFPGSRTTQLDVLMQATEMRYKGHPQSEVKAELEKIEKICPIENAMIKSSYMLKKMEKQCFGTTFKRLMCPKRHWIMLDRYYEKGDPNLPKQCPKCDAELFRGKNQDVSELFLLSIPSHSLTLIV